MVIAMVITVAGSYITAITFGKHLYRKPWVSAAAVAAGVPACTSAS